MFHRSLCLLSKTTHYDVAILGGGHNALVSACYLSKSNKRVVVLEKASQFGGATQSVYAFPGVKAKLSRYSYLVSLFPDKIKEELGLEFDTLRRKVSWYAPHDNGGVLLNRLFDEESRRNLERFAVRKRLIRGKNFIVELE